MKIRNELDFYRMIAKKPKSKDVAAGIGDDAAVFKSRAGSYAVTTDMIVEGDHFSLDYFSPYEIGIKAMESNASDIAAMGATPLFAFVSISLKPGTSERFLKEFYRGLHRSCAKHKIDILGGDTTHGDIMVVNVTLIGHASPGQKLVYRSGAKEGDLIFVTGKLGASTAGLKLFLKKIKGHEFVKKKHTQPACRLDVSGKIAKFATAMEDVSDGLASEIRNICMASGKGAIICADCVPIADATYKAAAVSNLGALEFALYGGEDFELVYTAPKSKRREAEKYGTCVGEITSGSGKVFLKTNGDMKLLRKFGFDHFAL